MRFGPRKTGTDDGLRSLAYRQCRKEDHMPLFFIIAIAAGALTLGATTADVTGAAPQNAQARAAAAQARPTTFQAGAYVTYDDCVRAAAQQSLPASACMR